MRLQPGVGYNFYSSSSGMTLDIGEPFPSSDQTGNTCPLSVYGFKETSGSFYINVFPGMVNNLVVKSDDGVLLTDSPPPEIQVFAAGLTTSDVSQYVYIKSGNTAASGPTPAAYPAKSGLGYPSIRIYDTNDKADDDDNSYILIAVITGKKVLIPGSDPAAYTYDIRIQKMIGCNSLWTERFKCGTSTAVYWWSAV